MSTPAPVSVIAGRLVPAPVTAAGVAESEVPVVVLVHAARASALIAAAAALMVLDMARRDLGPCLPSLAGMMVPCCT